MKVLLIFCVCLLSSLAVQAQQDSITFEVTTEVINDSTTVVVKTKTEKDGSIVTTKSKALPDDVFNAFLESEELRLQTFIDEIDRVVIDVTARRKVAVRELKELKKLAKKPK